MLSETMDWHAEQKREESIPVVPLRSTSYDEEFLRDETMGGSTMHMSNGISYYPT